MESNLGDSIEHLLFQPKLSRIKIHLRDDNIMFIQYNDYDEYGYSFIFSKIELDRCRFDNYDDKWNVSTRPHHYHPRHSREGIESNMIGEPNHDIPLLCDLYKSGKLFFNGFRFYSSD